MLFIILLFDKNMKFFFKIEIKINIISKFIILILEIKNKMYKLQLNKKTLIV